MYNEHIVHVLTVEQEVYRPAFEMESGYLYNGATTSDNVPSDVPLTSENVSSVICAQ